jgi:hypothetical protein
MTPSLLPMSPPAVVAVPSPRLLDQVAHAARQRGASQTTTAMFGEAGWVALTVTRQGCHGPGRPYINASGSSADRLAIPEGSPALSEHVAWTGCGASLCPPVSRARVCRPGTAPAVRANASKIHKSL